jgi:IS1 family transposase
MGDDQMNGKIEKIKRILPKITKNAPKSRKTTLQFSTAVHNTSTFRRLYDKVKHLKACTFYTDRWEAFAEVLPLERPIIGKEHTACIERENSNTHHHWGRMTRKTKVVAKCEERVDVSLRICHDND